MLVVFELRVEGRVLVLGAGRQGGVHPVEAADGIVHDVKLALRAGQRVELAEAVVERFAVVLQIADDADSDTVALGVLVAPT